MSYLSSWRANALERDRRARRIVWAALAITLVGGALMYSAKAREDRSAIIRWLYQVNELRQDGVNIWDTYMFPTPPIFALTLYPLTYLPDTAAALLWYGLKIGLLIASILMCLRLARVPDDTRPVPWWALLLILLLSIRPILSDLHHGNNNLVILFLIVSCLYAWRKGYDVLAGLALALAITYKLTPALFLPYFMYKRSWRLIGASFLGIGGFLLIVPSLILGPEFNGQCLHMWWHRMLRPYVVADYVGSLEINQSMPGVLARIFTEQPDVDARYVPESGLNLFAWDPQGVVWMIKGLSLVLVGLLAYLCRTPAGKRTDPRMLGEFSLVVLTMLIVSERSWKHHYVTLLLPYTYLVIRLWMYPVSKRIWTLIGGTLAASALLMLSTSTEVGRLFGDGEGHQLALYYGMFFWAGVVLYLATAWRVLAERHAPDSPRPKSIPAPHVGQVVESARTTSSSH